MHMIMKPHSKNLKWHALLVTPCKTGNDIDIFTLRYCTVNIPCFCFTQHCLYNMSCYPDSIFDNKGLLPLWNCTQKPHIASMLGVIARAHKSHTILHATMLHIHLCNATYSAQSCCIISTINNNKALYWVQKHHMFRAKMLFIQKYKTRLDKS